MKVIGGRHSPAITGQMCGGDVESKAILLDGGASPQVWIQPGTGKAVAESGRCNCGSAGPELCCNQPLRPSAEGLSKAGQGTLVHSEP